MACLLEGADLLQQPVHDLFNGHHFGESLFVILIVIGGFVLQHYLFQRLLNTQAEKLQTERELLIADVKNSGQENLLALQEQIRSSARLADIRTDGLDVLLERGKLAKRGAEALAELTDQIHTPEAQRIVAARSLRSITEFLEPIDPKIKFNFFQRADTRLFEALCGTIVDLVLAVDPKRCGIDPTHDQQMAEIKRDLSHRFDKFETHSLCIIRPDPAGHV